MLVVTYNHDSYSSKKLQLGIHACPKGAGKVMPLRSYHSQLIPLAGQLIISRTLQVRATVTADRRNSGILLRDGGS